MKDIAALVVPRNFVLKLQSFSVPTEVCVEESHGVILIQNIAHIHWNIFLEMY